MNTEKSMRGIGRMKNEEKTKKMFTMVQIKLGIENKNRVPDSQTKFHNHHVQARGMYSQKNKKFNGTLNYAQTTKLNGKMFQMISTSGCWKSSKLAVSSMLYFNRKIILMTN